MKEILCDFTIRNPVILEYVSATYARSNWVNFSVLRSITRLLANIFIISLPSLDVADVDAHGFQCNEYLLSVCFLRIVGLSAWCWSAGASGLGSSSRRAPIQMMRV